MKAIHYNFRFRKFEFEVHLAEHCNLNCMGCDNFSPLASEEFPDPAKLIRDFKQIYSIFGDKVGSIRLLGGEPLLNPDINIILAQTRHIFKKANIIIVSNGLLLPKKELDFFDTCRENHIQILLTKYPVSFNYDEILKDISAKGIICGTFSNEEIKTLYRKPLDISGTQNPTKMFDYCLNAARCITLKDGKLYTCTTIPNIYHFNNMFQKNIKVTAHDYIDIYAEPNSRKIQKFLSKPVPFCRYCKTNLEEFGIKWCISKKEIGEWADE